MNSKIKTTLFINRKLHAEFKSYCKNNEFALTDGMESLIQVLLSDRGRHLSNAVKKRSILNKCERINEKIAVLKEKFIPENI